MAATYTLIDSYTVGAGGAASVTLGSGGTIPQTYTDLKVIISDRNNRTSAINDAIGLNFNGSATSFTSRRLYGDGGSAYSDTEPLYPIIDNSVNSTTSTFSNIEFYIPNYTSSNYKSFSGDGVMENNSSTAYATLSASLWSNTAAITSITIVLQNASFVQYSTFYLYGIKNS